MKYDNFVPLYFAMMVAIVPAQYWRGIALRKLLARSRDLGITEDKGWLDIGRFRELSELYRKSKQPAQPDLARLLKRYRVANMICISMIAFLFVVPIVRLTWFYE